MPKFPNVHVKLVGEDGNAFFILGRVAKAMKRGGCTKEEVAAYMKEAKSGDYDNLLRVTMATVATDDGWDEQDDFDDAEDEE